MSGVKPGRATTTVALMSNNFLLHLGLQKIVETEQWIRLIDHVTTGMNIDDIPIREQPHIMIVDTEIESDVPGCIRKVKAAASHLKIILLSGLDNTECTRQAIAVGVDGIVLKVQPSAVLIATIAHLACPSKAITLPIGGEAAHVNMSKTPDVPTPITWNPDQSKWPEGLTEREREIIRLISEGLSNKDIADRLCISSITVRHHLTNIFDKLGVSNRQKLLICAHRYGLVRPPALA